MMRFTYRTTFTCLVVVLSILRAYARRPIVIGHRGSPCRYPEETLEGYQYAVEAGADFIELDVVSSKDHVLIAHHDVILSRTSNVAEIEEFRNRSSTKKVIDLGNKMVSGFFVVDFTLEEIKRMRARQAFPFRDHSFDDQFEISTLSEVLQLVRNARNEGSQVGVYIETKSPAFHNQQKRPLESLLVESLKENDLLHDPGAVYLQSFSMESLETLHELLVQEDVSVPMTWLLDGGEPLPSPRELERFAKFGTALGPDKKSLAEMQCGVRECNRQKMESCFDFNPNQTCAGHLLKSESGLTRLSPLISMAREAELELHPYTFRNEELFMAIDFLADPLAEMEFFVSEENGIAADGFFTDCPETAMEFLKTPCTKQNMMDDDDDTMRNVKGWSLGITFLTVFLAVVIGVAILYLRHKKRRETNQFVELASDTPPKRQESPA